MRLLYHPPSQQPLHENRLLCELFRAFRVCEHVKSRQNWFLKYICIQCVYVRYPPHTRGTFIFKYIYYNCT